MPLYVDAKVLMAQALRKLLTQRNLDTIAVTDIVNQAKLSRATFYRHFRDKYDLMIWIYRSVIDKIIEENPAPEQSVNILIGSCRYLKENYEYFSNVVKYNGQNSFIDFVASYVSSVTVQRVQKQFGSAKLPEEINFDLQFYCGGASYISREWIVGGCKGSPEKIARRIFDCIPSPLKKYLE